MNAMNICEWAGKADSHPGSWVSSHSCLANVLWKADFQACRPYLFYARRNLCNLGPFYRQWQGVGL